MNVGRILITKADQETVSILIIPQQIIHLISGALCIRRIRISSRQYQCIHLESAVGTGYAPCHAQSIIAILTKSALVVQFKTKLIRKRRLTGLLIHHRRIALPYLVPAIQIAVVILVIISAAARRLIRRPRAFSQDPQPALRQCQFILIHRIGSVKGAVAAPLVSGMLRCKAHQCLGIFHALGCIGSIRILYHICGTRQSRCHFTAYHRVVGLPAQPVGLALIRLLFR